MTYNVEVRPTRLLITSGNDIIGVQGEDGVTTLSFLFPQDFYPGFNRLLRITTAANTTTLKIGENNTVVLSSNVTDGTWADMSVLIMDQNEGTIWKSRSRRFYFRADANLTSPGESPDPGEADTEQGAITNAQRTQQEADRRRLIESLQASDINHELTTDDYNSLTWIELLALVEHTTMVNTEQYSAVIDAVDSFCSRAEAALGIGGIN